MKRIININISKDTPEETLAALNAALKTGKEKSFLKVSELYVLNEDIEKLHERYEQLFKQVKTSLNLSETLTMTSGKRKSKHEKPRKDLGGVAGFGGYCFSRSRTARKI